MECSPTECSSTDLKPQFPAERRRHVKRNRTVKCWNGLVLERLPLEGRGSCTPEVFGEARYERSRLVPERVER